ncbi:type II toxin-antitoxin system VapB family antitoxin [Cyanobium sp. LEGE 06143]|uniref:type II toxin-antitoxin system VapB family antitoxin n=1 Tax=Cyanobium sp. LEGE 06143 TaxID=945727 RepID=UPI00188061BA|nr:type II toxin-antitoxin system VapB family antitoxin [Cyanobium sp. LEGE 06143]
MALNIRNAEASRLAAEVASLAGETQTAAVILALKERLRRLQRQSQTTANRQASIINRLDQIALRCAGRPIGDRRSAEEIIGYNAMGLPT